MYVDMWICGHDRVFERRFAAFGTGGDSEQGSRFEQEKEEKHPAGQVRGGDPNSTQDIRSSYQPPEETGTAYMYCCSVCVLPQKAERLQTLNRCRQFLNFEKQVGLEKSAQKISERGPQRGTASSYTSLFCNNLVV